jgi:MFS family permease
MRLAGPADLGADADTACGRLPISTIGFVEAAAAEIAPRAARFALLATILGSSMVFIDSTVVNVALPSIQRDLGGALLTPASLAVITSTFAGHERGATIGTWTAWSGISTVIGPLLGGWLIGISSRRH